MSDTNKSKEILLARNKTEKSEISQAETIS